jgi:hypothetical protein
MGIFDSQDKVKPSSEPVHPVLNQVLLVPGDWTDQNQLKTLREIQAKVRAAKPGSVVHLSAGEMKILKIILVYNPN